MAKMSAKTRHLRRIRQQIRRMEKRGYEFDESFKAGLKERSARSLAQIKTEGLYKRSKLKIPDIETGEIKTVSGTEGRSFERSQAAKKSAETRKWRKRISAYDDYDYAANDHDYYIPDISDDVITYLDELLFKLGQPVSQMAEAKDGHLFPKDSALRTYSSGAKNTLQKMLNDEIQRLDNEGKNGREIVARRIYDNADVIDDSIGIIEYSAYAGDIQTAIIKFAQVIRGNREYSREERSIELADFLEEEYDTWGEI